jgi:hypothetical protein
MIESKIEDFGLLMLPAFTGTRVMMMPFLMQEPHDSLPDSLAQYRESVARVCALATVKSGVGYLTIDESLVRAGETHRRPGLHVDGFGAYGGGGGYARNGMFLAASHEGCAGYPGLIDADPAPEGDCEHMRALVRNRQVMRAGRVYWCGPMAVHESLPMVADTRRQLLRISMPSDAPHHREYTPNPTGVQPTGEPAAPRPAQMSFRV